MQFKERNDYFMIKHSLTCIPKDIRKETTIITIFGIITSLGFDMLAFFLQLGKNQIAKGNIIVGLVFIAIYYLQRTLDTSLSLWMDDIQNTYAEHYKTTVSNRVVQVLQKVRGKVWRRNTETNSREKMSTNILLRSSKSYINLVWDFKTGLPRNIFQIISVLLMFIGFILVTTVEIKNTLVFVMIITIVSVFSVVFSIRRNKVRDRFRKKRKQCFEKEDMALNDILNIEPVNSKHAIYMANKYIDVTKERYSLDKKDRKGLNKVNFFESVMDSLATIAIIATKVVETGLENVNLEVVLSIIALVSIYTQIMNRVNSIIHMIESTKENLKNIKSYESDFFEIVQVYDRETDDTTGDYGVIESVIVPEFNVQYQAIGVETPFSLENEKSIQLIPGDIVLLEGPTGSGKSTLMKMVTGMIEFEGFELYYKRKANGTVNTLMHQTDGKLGYSDVLSEITFDEEVDKERLFYILKGLHLYEEISAKDEDILRYLKNSSASDYSTGQKQRLAIARLLYNMDDTIQIIGFDEATNALNDAITLQTLSFIKDYCRNKILLIATHQVDIGETVANKKLEFVPNGAHYTVKM